MTEKQLDALFELDYQLIMIECNYQNAAGKWMQDLQNALVNKIADAMTELSLMEV